jgi:hypothetical protein
MDALSRLDLTEQNIHTAGSDWPPQQSAKQTSGSGFEIAYDRLSSLPFSFDPGKSRLWNHFTNRKKERLGRKK